MDEIHEILSLTDLEKLKFDCSYWNDTDHNDDENGDKRHFHFFIWRIVEPYMNSKDFTVQDFNTLSHIEKLYCFELMTDSVKFIEFFKTPATLNTLPGIRLEFIEKQDKTLVKKFVNSADFTIDIFKVLDRDVKIYIILLFNSTRATEYLFEKSDIISNFKQLAAFVNWPPITSVAELRSFIDLASYFQKFIDRFAKIIVPLSNLLNEGHFISSLPVPAENAFQALKRAIGYPRDLIYVYYPFLILRALKADKRFFNSIEKSQSTTRQMSFLQTFTKIDYIKIIIKKMKNIRLKDGTVKNISGLNSFLRATHHIRTKGEPTGSNISKLTEDNFQHIVNILYPEYDSVKKVSVLKEKLETLIKKIDEYKKRNKHALDNIKEKINDAYIAKSLQDIPKKPDEQGDKANFDRYQFMLFNRAVEEYKIIDEVYSNNDAVGISKNSNSSKSNPLYEKILVSARIDNQS